MFLQFLTILYSLAIPSTMQAVAMDAAKANMTMMKSTMLYHDFLLKNNFGVKAITLQNTCCKIIKTNSALDLQTSKIKYMERASSRLRMMTTVGLPAQLKATSTMMKEMSRVMSRRVISRNQMFSTVLLSFQCKYFLLQPLENRDENHFHFFSPLCSLDRWSGGVWCVLVRYDVTSSPLEVHISIVPEIIEVL